ncbi:MAG: hypothetical protein HY744_23825, partial [Deltaproteobacteria bacterium]|nr:hypothetical protein [Deltaproteobacteria bacterium]
GTKSAPGGRPAWLGATAGEPVVTANLSFLYHRRHRFRDGEGEPAIPYGALDSRLVPYALASPNQFDAGSCLFMASTGAMELLMNQLLPGGSFQLGGDTDLSERYLMNASEHASPKQLRYVLTDTIYTYNVFSGSLLDRDYPFAIGYVKETASGDIVKAKESDPDAYASCAYSWFDELPEGWEGKVTPTPPVERTSIFVDPKRDDQSYWRVALMDWSVVDKIKYELRTKQAPIVVVYNHFLYWHAVMIVGYDDTVDAKGCGMVDQAVSYFKKNGAKSYADKIEKHKQNNGGCTEKGIFFVRDSIYDGGSEEPMYTYGGGYGYKEKYSKRIIEEDYDWVTYLGNHAYAVHRR